MDTLKKELDKTFAKKNLYVKVEIYEDNHLKITIEDPKETNAKKALKIINKDKYVKNIGALDCQNSTISDQELNKLTSIKNLCINGSSGFYGTFFKHLKELEILDLGNCCSSEKSKLNTKTLRNFSTTNPKLKNLNLVGYLGKTQEDANIIAEDLKKLRNLEKLTLDERNNCLLTFEKKGVTVDYDTPKNVHVSSREIL